MPDRYGRVLIPVIFVLAALTACCGLQGGPPVSTYGLEPRWEQVSQAGTGKRSGLVLEVAPVRGAAPLQTTDILYADRSHSLQGYAYSRWRDAPVKAMGMLLEAAVGNSGLFLAVLPSSSAADADLVLESALLECGHVIGEDGASQGVVRMRVHLIDNKNRKVIAGRELTGKVPAATVDAAGGVAAINQAASMVAEELVAWLALFQF